MIENEQQALMPGARLRIARETKGYSVEEVSRSLRLPLSVIQGIEDNDYEQFPTTFLKGYLRSYAKFLNMDGNDILQSYNSLGLDKPAEPLVGQPNMPKAKPVIIGRKPPSFRWLSYVALAGIALTLVSLTFHGHKHDHSVIATSATTEVALAPAQSTSKPIPEPSISQSGAIKPTVTAKLSPGSQKPVDTKDFGPRVNLTKKKQPTAELAGTVGQATPPMLHDNFPQPFSSVGQGPNNAAVQADNILAMHHMTTPSPKNNG